MQKLKKLVIITQEDSKLYYKLYYKHIGLNIKSFSKMPRIIGNILV